MNGRNQRPTSLPAQEWRGAGRDAGLYVPPQWYAPAVDEYEKANGFRRDIDSAMSAVAGGLDPRHAGAQVGADDSLKDWESYVRKVAVAHQLKGKSIGQAIAQYDLHRYTYTFPPERYVEGVRDCYDKLTEAGFTPQAGRNYWDCDYYKGINTVWNHNDTGQQVEVQFHTPRSYEIKQETHPYYKVRRSPRLADGETEVPPDVKQACDWRAAEAYRSTELGNECQVPEEHEALWPGQLDRTRVGRPPEQALATADQEAAIARQEALPRQADGAGLQGAGRQGVRAGPPRPTESMRRQFTHLPDRLDPTGRTESPERESRRQDREAQ